MPDEARAPLLSRDRIDETDNRSDHGSGDATTDYGSVYRYPLYLQPGQFTSLEKLMFFVSSILLILLCIFIGLYARSSFGDHLTPPPSTPTSIPNPLPPPEQNEVKMKAVSPSFERDIIIYIASRRTVWNLIVS